MKRKTVLPELLAPAGNLQAFYAAVEAGADAVYLGIAEGATNARVGAENFTRESLAAIIPYAHANGVLAEATLKAENASNHIGAIADQVSAQLKEYQDSVLETKATFQEAVATLYAIRPNETEE